MRPIHFSRRGAISVLAGLLLAAAVTSAAAADGLVQTLQAGTRTASIGNLTLGALTYSHDDQTSSGTLTLTADDSTGSDLGWNVTVQSSSLTYSGNYAGTSIPAANLALGTPGAPTMTAGQAVDATNGPKAGVGGTLDAARKVIYANAGYGKGTYTQSLPVTLTVPGGSLAGSYTATFTVTISSGP